MYIRAYLDRVIFRSLVAVRGFPLVSLFVHVPGSLDATEPDSWEMYITKWSHTANVTIYLLFHRRLQRGTSDKRFYKEHRIPPRQLQLRFQ